MGPEQNRYSALFTHGAGIRLLLYHKSDVYSQTGEDGSIEAILSRIGDLDSWCVKFGVLDGRHICNTRNLIEARNYRAILIEGDASRRAALGKFYGGNDRIFPLNAFVGFNEANRLDALPRETPVPADFDFVSIDIDGNDYHVWNAVRQYRPELVVIEFNLTLPTNCHFVQKLDHRVNQCSSFSTLTALATAKGYKLGCILQFNEFITRDDLFPRLEIADNSPFFLRQQLCQLTFLFQCFDGTIFLYGNRRMPWHDLDIDLDDVQALPASLRKFPSAYSPF